MVAKRVKAPIVTSNAKRAFFPPERPKDSKKGQIGEEACVKNMLMLQCKSNVLL